MALAACGTTGGQSVATATPGKAPASTPTRTASEPRRGSYAALGASETYGVGAEPRTKGYAYLVARGLNASPFVDEGIPGTTLDAAYQTELDGALAIRPQLCTVFFGFNDIAQGVTRGAFLLDLHDFVLTLRRAGAQVLIVGLPDLALLPAVSSLHLPGVEEEVAVWNHGMAQAARQTGAHFLDLRGYSQDLASHPEYVSSDGLHPSNAGHRRLAQVILQTVRREHLWSRR